MKPLGLPDPVTCCRYTSFEAMQLAADAQSHVDAMNVSAPADVPGIAGLTILHAAVQVTSLIPPSSQASRLRTSRCLCRFAYSVCVVRLLASAIIAEVMSVLKALKPDQSP